LGDGAMGGGPPGRLGIGRGGAPEEEVEQGGHREEERLVAQSPELGEQREEEAVAGRVSCALLFQGASSPAEGSGWSGHPEKYRPLYRVPLRADIWAKFGKLRVPAHLQGTAVDSLRVAHLQRCKD
jgi:hypothetical protein